jgi:hypothetical protein
VLADAGMSRNYFYKRLRGEAPFNTNDVGNICDVLGIDPMQLMCQATKPRLSVVPATDDEHRGEDWDVSDASHLSKLPTAAKRGRKKADEPHAE